MPSYPAIPLTSALLLGVSVPVQAESWWNEAWAQRQEIVLDAGAAALSDAPGPSTVLVRLHEGNFSFLHAAPDGNDLRFVAADGKTLLPHHIETFDSLLNEAFVWVKLPEVKPSARTSFHVYYGSPGASQVPAADPASAYGPASRLIYHFADGSDATSHGNAPAVPGTIAAGSLIGSGLRLLGNNPLTIPASDSLRWTQGQDLTLSFWLKATALQDRAVLLHRGGEGGTALRLLLDQGRPLVEVGNLRSSPAEPISAGAWVHLALLSQGGTLQLVLDGKPYAELGALLPASNEPMSVGALPPDAAAPDAEPFIGELDEWEIVHAARPLAALQLAVANQGPGEAASETLFLGQVEGGAAAGGHSQALEHVLLFGDIAKNMMFDGWIAIGICVIMILVGWSVAIRKFLYLNSIQKGTQEFLRQWKLLSADLTALDHADDQSVRSLGGRADPETQALVQKSPLYQIYHIGSEEIRHRLARDKDRTQGLSGRSIQAIRAALDAGLVHANHKLTNGLVYLTISIAGGPYVGLLGTVVGVMITFAIIAKSGEVDVNSIAPGIASALLATVAGLVVAIPALFIYSYLNSRIKNSLAEIHVFIDEFVAKMAEFYPPAGEASPYAAKDPRTPNA